MKNKSIKNKKYLQLFFDFNYKQYFFAMVNDKSGICSKSNNIRRYK